MAGAPADLFALFGRQKSNLERIMDFSSLFGLFSGGWWMDELLVWVVAFAAAIVGVFAIVNALNMFFEAEAG